MMTPKSLLRHKMAISSVDDFTGNSSFHRTLWDDRDQNPNHAPLADDKDIKRVVLCTGKVYYDLFEKREEMGVDDVYILRVEQLYPIAQEALVAEMKRFSNAEFVWCQEEPVNQGYWSFINPHIEQLLSELGAKKPRPKYIGRKAAAAPATGQASAHKRQQDTLVEDALTVKG